ncbi:hypothetical protein [Streptomyces sp. P17]|uniref:hypothetical protein n=1 Tax=Streptomyces sp. P17 TaxID=3074716 RepID=UPI0028F42D8D|nr:hypothetical protein [Streptomyces sp. P17]MDT9696985.1 hypothetical protein [Streptomyces sp. P17]
MRSHGEAEQPPPPPLGLAHDNGPLAHEGGELVEVGDPPPRARRTGVVDLTKLPWQRLGQGPPGAQDRQ